ncbi:AAA family ATPase [Acinetobacter junii]|uniref:AAA family ATPase n=1 Tax=Acinetobacter junii TaxID=40215 RepID=UPI00285AC937|nr:DUF3696 domain-containing protein [Acinetobacter junii]MDR7654236.1 DUF3696 domain-containing protein [Acinetobacter junii]
MIKSLSLENFKSFKNLDNLQIKPLTILLGRNSCGKSSIIQSLLLLKQTIEQNNDADLNVEGKYLKFSNLKDISYGLPNINNAAITYEFGVESGEEFSNIRLEFKNKKKEESYVPSLTGFIHKNNNKEINLKKIKNSDLSDDLKDLLKRLKEKKVEFVEGRPKFETIFKNFMPKAIRHVSNKDFILPLNFVYEKLMIDEFEKDLRKIKYLSPLRASPERIYVHYSQSASEISENGANSAHVLWARRNQMVYLNNQENNLLVALGKCIEILGLGQEITSKKISEMVYQIGLKLKNSNGLVSLADVGFGYSQVLPVILIGLLNNNNNLILIEQPEIHLHPSSAGKLADLFLAFIKDKKTFLIETHSQEFINKLRLRVIQDPTLKEFINIVFIDQDENGTKIKQFEIDETGMFPEWPRGFLDESENIAREILKARVKSRNA